MFATADHSVGDLILDERPLFVMPQKLPVILDSSHKELWGRFTEAAHAAFYNLANVKDSTCPLEWGIIRTNSFGIKALPGCNELHVAVLEYASRCNHSCTLSAICSF